VPGPAASIVKAVMLLAPLVAGAALNAGVLFFVASGLSKEGQG